jgi:hypothetical protein
VDALSYWLIRSPGDAGFIGGESPLNLRDSISETSSGEDACPRGCLSASLSFSSPASDEEDKDGSFCGRLNPYWLFGN